ncbi:MAG: DUF99 family protein [Candidatus Lokiarchaeota archaeon]|nr:DUF99 family protein [Candidatus Lokiarchaeota archaeon]
MKDSPITIGFDDATFNLKTNIKTTQLIGVICQGTRMVRVVRDNIKIDGDDATEKIIKLVRDNEKHVQYVLTHTITFGGFNLVNLTDIYTETGKPIIAITEREVDFDSVESALKSKFPNTYEGKLRYIVEAGNLYETDINTAGGISKLFFHCKGINVKEVELLLEKICIDSKLPESVRIAHLIGKIF